MDGFANNYLLKILLKISIVENIFSLPLFSPSSLLDRSVAEIKLFVPSIFYQEEIRTRNGENCRFTDRDVCIGNDSCEIVQLIRGERKWTLNGLVREEKKEILISTFLGDNRPSLPR